MLFQCVQWEPKPLQELSLYLLDCRVFIVKQSRPVERQSFVEDILSRLFW